MFMTCQNLISKRGHSITFLVRQAARQVRVICIGSENRSTSSRNSFMLGLLILKFKKKRNRFSKNSFPLTCAQNLKVSLFLNLSSRFLVVEVYTVCSLLYGLNYSRIQTLNTSPILRSLLFQHGMDEVKRKHSVFVPHFSWHFLQQQILRQQRMLE